MKLNLQLIVIIQTLLSATFLHASADQKQEFRSSEQAIKNIYNQVSALLNEKGKKALRDDQAEWLQKRKEVVSSYANYSTEQANKLIIELNWKRVKQLKDFYNELKKNLEEEKSSEPGKLPPDIQKKLDAVMSIIDEGAQLVKQSKQKEGFLKFDAALSLARNTLPDSDAVAINVHLQKAYAYAAINENNLAIENFQKALEFSEKTFGPKNPTSADILEALAASYNSVAQRGKALDILFQAKDIKENHFGKSDIRLVSTLRDIAYTVFGSGDYNSSYLYAEQADKLVENVRKSNPSLTASVKILMGLILSQLGFHDLALSAYKDAIQLSEASGDPKLSLWNGSLSGLANVHEQLGNFGEALSIQERIMAFQKEAPDIDPTSKSNTLRSIANIQSKLGELQKAIDILLPLANSTEPGADAGRVLALNNLGMVYADSGNQSLALEYLDKSLTLGKEINGPSHPITIQTMANIARISAAKGDEVRARSAATQWVSALEDRRKTVFNLSEGERLLWVMQNFDFGIPLFCLRPEQNADIILRWKGVVLDSILEDRAIYKRVSSSDGGPQLVQEIQDKKNEVAAVLSEKNYDRKKFEELQRTVELMESSIASQAMGDGRIRNFSLASHEQIVESMPPSSAVVDFVTFFNHLKKRKSYAASVINSDGSVQIAIIEDGNKVDELINEYRKQILNKESDKLRITLRKLFSLVWEPINDKLSSGTNTIFLGSDGALNFLSFATLLDDDAKFLCDKIDFKYVGTGRDLLKKNDSIQENKIVIYADPKFSADISVKNSFAMRSLDLTDASEIFLEPLPGSMEEAKMISQLASDNGMSSEIQIGNEANEINLQSIKSPSILHLATHGFYIGHNPIGASQTRGMQPVPNSTPAVILNPMRQGAVTLAGAQSTLQKWNSGTYPDPKNDGILTAEEVAGLNLSGTWLVVLSSCDSGSGLAQAGEGVYGLRRGFLIAGARNLLITLWPVSDQFTPKFMSDFYSELFTNKNPAASLAKVQREWLNRLLKEQDLATAVGLAGPYVVTVTGSSH